MKKAGRPAKNGTVGKYDFIRSSINILLILRFMSGYTGFVPKARKYLGQGYPIISQQALSEHFSEKDRLDRLKSAPVETGRVTGTLARADTAHPKAGSLLYPKSSGLVPRYTGHIPSHRFSFGVPFGQSTQNALATLPRD